MINGTPPRWTISPQPHRPRWSEVAAPQVLSGLGPCDPVIYASELAVKKGGVVVLITPCPEGISPSHPEVLELGYQTFDEVNQKVYKGMIQKLTVAAHLVHVGRVIKERARGILVCPGISKMETEKLGFLYAREPQEALEIAFSLTGCDAKVAVLQRGGEILPAIRNM